MANVTIDPTTRAPASPLTGFIRSVVAVPLSGFIASKLMGLGITIEAAAVATVITGIITATGKLLRDRGYGWAIW
jgi:hypothetical protein